MAAFSSRLVAANQPVYRLKRWTVKNVVNAKRPEPTYQEEFY